jgi:hypothetical protein
MSNNLKFKDLNQDILEKIYEEVILLNISKITEEEKFKKEFYIMLDKEKIKTYKYLYKEENLNEIELWNSNYNKDFHKYIIIESFIDNYCTNLSILSSLNIIHNYGLIQIVEESKHIRKKYTKYTKINIETEYYIMVKIIFEYLLKTDKF